MSKLADFVARYEVDDGYVGGSRPQSFKIRDGDYDYDPDASDEKLEQIFYDAVDEHMRQRITFCKTNEAAFVEWAREQMKRGD